MIRNHRLLIKNFFYDYKILKKHHSTNTWHNDRHSFYFSCLFVKNTRYEFMYTDNIKRKNTVSNHRSLFFFHFTYHHLQIIWVHLQIYNTKYNIYIWLIWIYFSLISELIIRLISLLISFDCCRRTISSIVIP